MALDYKTAKAMLGKRSSRKLCNNTYLKRQSGQTPEKPPPITVRLHSTDIVTFEPNGRITLDLGGYNTVTTRNRMNSYIPQWLRVWSESGYCVVGIEPRGMKEFSRQSLKRYPLADTLIVLPNRTVLKSRFLPDVMKQITDYKREQARARYADNRDYRKRSQLLYHLAPGIGEVIRCRKLKDLVHRIQYVQLCSWRGPLGEIQELVSINSEEHYIKDDRYFRAPWCTLEDLPAALEAMIPEQVRADRVGWIRQGEFYFRPLATEPENFGIKEQEAIDAVDNEPLIQYSRHRLTGKMLKVESEVEQFGGVVKQTRTAYAIGTITAPDHPTVTLDTWHEVAYTDKAID